MKKFKPITLESIIALYWKEAYYGTRRGEYHRGCCDVIPLGEGMLCSAKQYEIFSKRCHICYSELMIPEERAILTASQF